MKAIWHLLPLLMVSVGFAQEVRITERATEQTSLRADPTMPSAKIRERLAGNVASGAIVSAVTTPPPPALANAPAALPDFELKAIVMSDVNRGTALLECNGRKIVVPLVRAEKKSGAPSPSAHEKNSHSQRGRLHGFTFQGQTYTVEDFSSSTLLLKSGDRSLLVQ